MIPMHPRNATIPNEHAIVMFRQGHGAIGLTHALSSEELQRGHIPWSYGRFTLEEMKLLGTDPERAFFPVYDFGS